MYYAVIMAGGSGTRLWPLSRQHRPKQALAIVGNRTMFQYAVERVRPVFPVERIIVITRAEYASLLSTQVPDLPAENFILEPEGRGTAPAIGLAAIQLRKRDPAAIMAVLTADHYITGTEEFRRVLEAAACLAMDGRLVTLGIKPVAPSTGFGYIEQGHSLATVQGFPVFHVARFIEKPAPELAEKMLTSGRYCWNSGMFVWQVDRILEEFRSQMPDLYRQLVTIEAALDRPDFKGELLRAWGQVREQTIDYGVMENARDVVVIPVDIGWIDVGSWASLAELFSSDQDGNIFVGPCKEIDTHNTFVFGGRRLVATIGVQDIVIVDSDDALLVCARQREQEVREIVERLKTSGENQWL